MKKLSRKVLVSLALAAAIANPALAATLSNLSSPPQACDGEGTWHFVNNQTEGAAAGTLTATFSTGTFGPLGPSKVLKSVQQFFVFTVGNTTLVDATTTLPGRLVLSDFSCTHIVKPPVCDPKTDPKC